MEKVEKQKICRTTNLKMQTIKNNDNALLHRNKIRLDRASDVIKSAKEHAKFTASRETVKHSRKITEFRRSTVQQAENIGQFLLHLISCRLNQS